jgi:NitT/TauT family transport system permease protein
MNKDVSQGIRLQEHVHRDIVPATQKRPVHHRTAHLLVYSPPLLLAALLLLAWYALTAGGLVSSLLLPTPGDVFASLFSNLGILWGSLLITVQESVFGFLLALAIALPLGYGIAKSRLLALTLQPYVSAGQAIPALVIAPLLFIWLGYVMTANILVCTLVVFFPVVVNTILGMRTIDPALMDAARVEGASGWSLLAHIEFPLALPAILAAVRTGFTLSIVGATVAEFVNVNVPGLGALLVEAKNQYDVPLMFASILVLAMLAALYYALTGLLVRVAEAIY